MRLIRACVLLGLLILFAGILLPVSVRAQSTTAYTGTYYNNTDLSGTPAFIRQDQAIDFDWSSSTPDPAITGDNYSVRWTRWYNAESAGPYNLKLTSDDGSRLWVDGSLVLDMWYDHAAQAQTASLDLTAGYHLVRVEYYNRGGAATVHLDIAFAGTYPNWKAEYYNNANLSGTPVVVTDNPDVNFDWGTKAPVSGLPADQFSVRWTRDQYFDAGTYRFSLTTDDGSRVWVGDKLLIDQWRDQPPTAYTADITLDAGTYPLRIEHYDKSGTASVKLSWTPTLGGGIWNASYFKNADLSGNPVLKRQDADLTFDWGTAGPGSKVSGDVFSARWDSARIAPASQFYTVFATADDGVRVSVDGKRLIDEWRDQPPTTFGATVYLAAGQHNWQVEYYQHLGAASLSVQILPGVAAQPPVAPHDISVEQGGPGWIGGSAEWHTALAENIKLASGPNNAFFLPLTTSGRWYPTLPEARNYEVFAYIPGGVATTHSAHYLIAHAGTVSAQTIPQANYKDEWVSLGTYYFSALGTEYVLLPDVTYECARCFTIVWSSLKFSPR